MFWNRSLLAEIIVITTAFSAFAQVASTTDQSQPLANPLGAPVTLKAAFQDHFLIGVASNRSMATGAGGRRNKELVEKDIALVTKHFNQIAPENDMKWQLIHPREGADGYYFEPADAFVEFGQKNNMVIIGHTLVWHAQTPNWVFAGTNPPPRADDAADSAAGNAPDADASSPSGRRRRRFGGFGQGYTGPRASRDELLARMREHIHTVVGRYKGRIKAWDVVNEALSDSGDDVLRNSLWLHIIGPDYIAKAFEYAHEADPEAILRYNDYGLEHPAKHALTEMASLGLPIHITELDVNNAARGQRGTGADIAANADATEGGLVRDADQRLADAYAGIFRAFLKHRDSVKMVTFWGANDAVSWRRFGTPLLFDGENKPKPAFEAVLRVPTESQSMTE